MLNGIETATDERGAGSITAGAGWTETGAGVDSGCEIAAGKATAGVMIAAASATVFSRRLHGQLPATAGAGSDGAEAMDGAAVGGFGTADRVIAGSGVGTRFCAMATER